MSKLVAGSAWTTLSNGSHLTPWVDAAPGVVQSLVATPQPQSVGLSWLPPDAGSSAVTGYQVTVQPVLPEPPVPPVVPTPSPNPVPTPNPTPAPMQTISVAASTTSLTVPGLTNGSPYTFTVTATNAVGVGPALTTPTVIPVRPTSFVGSGPGSVTYGAPVTVGGILRAGDTHAALAGATVQVFTRTHGVSTWSLYQNLLTDAAGHVTTTLTPRKSVDVWLYHPGPAGWQSKSVTSTTLVRTGLTAGLSSSRVAARHAVRLTGHIAPAVAGVRVWREAASRGRWHIVATTVTRAGGYYGFRVTPAVRGSSIFRVVAAASSGRAAGVSPTVRLVAT
jgi:hypothetical protein